MVHFAVSPGLLRSLDGVLDVAFTDPPSSPRAQIDVFETDSWVSDGTIVKEENDGGRMKRATIEGTLSSGVFVRTSITQYFLVTDPDTKETKIVIRKDDAPPPAADGKLFFVTIKHSGTTSKVPLQSMEGDRERGYFELDFIGWVETSSTSSVTPEGELKGSVTVEGFRPSTVSIRAVEKKRAELVYVAALKDDFATAGTSDYGSLAKAYWDSVKDNRVAENSYLKRILDEIIALKPSLRNGLPLGVVNIVSHGGTEHWWIRWDKKWTSGDKTYDEEPPAWIKGIGAGDLLMGGSLRLEPAPDASVLDDASLVVLWACDVGWNPALLKEVRAQFGGRAQVLAPRFHVVYRKRDGATKPYLAEFWTLERRGTVDWPDEDSLARQLEEEYSRPSAPIATYRSWISSDWAKIAQIVSEKTEEDAFRTREVLSATFSASGLDHDEILDENDQLLSESKLLNRLFIADLKNPTPEEQGRRDMANRLGWTFVDPPTQAGGKYTLVGTGSLTTLSIVRLLKTDGNLVTPDLQNPDHFSSAP